MPRPRVIARSETIGPKKVVDPPVRPHMTQSTFDMFKRLAVMYFGDEDAASRKTHAAMRQAAQDAKILATVVAPLITELLKVLEPLGVPELADDKQSTGLAAIRWAIASAKREAGARQHAQGDDDTSLTPDVLAKFNEAWQYWRGSASRPFTLAETVSRAAEYALDLARHSTSPADLRRRLDQQVKENRELRHQLAALRGDAG